MGCSYRKLFQRKAGTTHECRRYALFKDWKEYWNDIHQKDYLKNLRNNLDTYNSIPNIQETNCLAYVQNFLNNKENK